MMKCQYQRTARTCLQMARAAILIKDYINARAWIAHAKNYNHCAYRYF